MKAALIRAAPLLIGAPAHGPIYDGPPPERFMADSRVVVSFGTVAECGTPPPGKVFLGCVRGDLIHMPNPCKHLDEGKFAVILCHELAHRANGWSGNHEL